jgi:hypothetical protein
VWRPLGPQKLVIRNWAQPLSQWPENSAVFRGYRRERESSLPPYFPTRPTNYFSRFHVYTSIDPWPLQIKGFRVDSRVNRITPQDQQLDLRFLGSRTRDKEIPIKNVLNRASPAVCTYSGQEPPKGAERRITTSLPPCIQHHCQLCTDKLPPKPRADSCSFSRLFV